MRQFEMSKKSLLAAVIMLAIPAAYAQQLWKYTDKDGKVTYSDKAPKPGEPLKPGEKAELVSGSSSTNVINAPKNAFGGVPQKLEDVKARAAEREKLRDQLQRDLDMAKQKLDEAKKALEDGREPTEEERQIVVGRDKKGKPTGANTIIRKPEYYERIAGLEEAVKNAESQVDKAEQNLRRNAP